MTARASRLIVDRGFSPGEYKFEGRQFADDNREYAAMVSLTFHSNNWITGIHSDGGGMHPGQDSSWSQDPDNLTFSLGYNVRYQSGVSKAVHSSITTASITSTIRSCKLRTLWHVTDLICIIAVGVSV